MVGQHLPRAYRSRPRPSSALGAKASAVCPCSLDRKEHLRISTMEFSRCARTASARRSAQRTVSQSSTAHVVRNTEVDVLLGELGHLTAEAIEEPNAYRSNGSGIPRKEVIQPQLPLRLPCYDFTPIIDPTFDGSLPCGLGHRLRVLPTVAVWPAVCTRH